MADSPALDGKVPLSEMIQTLRKELQESMSAGAGDPLRFAVKSVELELQIAIGREGQAGGGVKFWVVDVRGEQKTSERTTHTFKLTLQPVTADGGEVRVSDAGRPPR